MSIIVKDRDAEANFAKLLKAARDGEEVIITSDNLPIAKLVLVVPKGARKFGAMKGQFSVGPEVFAPLTEEELSAWE